MYSGMYNKTNQRRMYVLYCTVLYMHACMHACVLKFTFTSTFTFRFTYYTEDKTFTFIFTYLHIMHHEGEGRTNEARVRVRRKVDTLVQSGLATVVSTFYKIKFIFRFGRYVCIPLSSHSFKLISIYIQTLNIIAIRD